MKDESKIVWADELWAPPSSMRWVNGGHIVATQLSLRFIEGEFTHPLYSHPPQRTWVGLTKEEIAEFDTWHDNREEEVGWCNPSEIVAYIEAKLKEKNT